MVSYNVICIAVGLLSLAALQQDNSSNNAMWGGRGVSMTMTAQGAMLEFDCARGVLNQPIRPDAKGQFEVAGTYTPERGGPVSKANPPGALNATYKGSIQGDTMHLEIILSDDEKAQAPFSLTRGKAGRLVRCR